MYQFIGLKVGLYFNVVVPIGLIHGDLILKAQLGWLSQIHRQSENALVYNYCNR